MSVELRCRRISTWPGRRTDYPQPARFDSAWGRTVTLLVRELGKLDASLAIMELDVRERDLRQDGWIRESARPASPGVVLSFDSKHGPLRYPCDTYNDWQDNVRAIALALEALRAVDRYGVTGHGEQYKGFDALPAPGNGAMTDDAAAETVAEFAGNGFTAKQVLGWRERYATAYKHAAMATHPDRNDGCEDKFKNLQRAKARLDLYHHDYHGVATHGT